MIGSFSDEYIVLVDNTYVSSFAFNLSKVELGSQLYPDEDDYADLMVGNLKKFVAEQRYLATRDGQSMQWVLEYLMKYNGRNRALDTRIRQRSDGLALLHLLSSCATFCLLLHEVGHVTYGVADYKDRQRDLIDRHIEAVVGRRHSHRRLEEEVFCDIFAMVNAITVLNRDDGWDANGLGNVCLHALLGALMCIKTRDVVQAALRDSAPVGITPSQDVLVARYEVAVSAIDEALRTEQERFKSQRRKVPFAGDKLNLRARWLEALEMPVRDAETRNLATIFASAFADPELGGFDHIMHSLNQISPLSDLSDVTDGVDIQRGR